MTSKEQAEQILRQLGPVPNGKTWGQHLVDHILASAAPSRYGSQELQDLILAKLVTPQGEQQ
jgi:hypothetical protein